LKESTGWKLANFGIDGTSETELHINHDLAVSRDNIQKVGSILKEYDQKVRGSKIIK
jgi:hypothetical protein